MNKKQLRRISLGVVVVLALLVSGFLVYRGHTSAPNPDGHLTVRGVAPGMSVDDVLGALGKPTETVGTRTNLYQIYYLKGSVHDPEVFCSHGQVYHVEGLSLESDGQPLLSVNMQRETALHLLGPADGEPETGQMGTTTIENVEYSKRHLKLTFEMQKGELTARTFYFTLGQDAPH